MVGMPRLTGGYGIGAEIPKIELGGFMSEIVSICGDTSLGERVMHLNLPGQVKGFVCDRHAGPTCSVEGASFSR